MLDGFNRHYRLFRSESARAKHRFETADWHAQQRAQRERIEFYDVRVRECVVRLEKEFTAAMQNIALWHEVKRHYIALLVAHCQPELAETFFNSVITKILHRTHFHNDFIFVRPAISTQYIEGREVRPSYYAYYPQIDYKNNLNNSSDLNNSNYFNHLKSTLVQILQGFNLQCPFVDLERDAARVLSVLQPHLSALKLRANFQIQVLSSLFYRNKGAYVVGKVINGFISMPFALPILHNNKGHIFIDAVLWGEDDLLALFSFARAYFMVDMEVPSAYVQFLASLMPRKPIAEIYTALGLAKQGKTLFYREFLWHLKHSSDQLRIAPGIKGMVMLVFDLPSFPYVFKLIKDEFPPQKEITREQVQAKYQLVKHHDRVGRMADTLEYSLVALPRTRFSEALITELLQYAPQQIEISDRDGDGQQEVIISHLYIERRMIPLNLYLQEAFDMGLDQPAARAQVERSVIDYGNAIKDLISANIFPGDMLWKNFGVTRGGKIVFYDYDEIEYLTDCQFRAIPPPRNEEDEMSGEIWWKVGPRDIFPETFAPFLLGHPLVRDVFMQHHADLLTPQYWQEHKERIQQGHMYDVFPYPVQRRFGPH